MMAVEGQQLAVAPYSTLIVDFVGGAPFPPGPLPLLGIDPPVPKGNLEQSTALRAIVDGLVDRKARATVPLEAGQLG